MTASRRSKDTEGWSSSDLSSSSGSWRSGSPSKEHPSRASGKGPPQRCPKVLSNTSKGVSVRVRRCVIDLLPCEAELS
jgi:hypothetical protein